MADVQINQPPGGTAPQPVPVETGGGSSAAWAIVVIVLLAIVAWFIFGRGMVGDSDRDTNIRADVKIEAPAAPAPATPAPATPPATKTP